MNNDLLYNIVLQLQGQNQVIAGINRVQNSTTGMVQKIQRQLNSIKLQSMISNIGSLADGLNALAGPGNEFNASMKDLQALTGLTGSKLKEVEGYARNAAKTFGGSAANSVESYKLLLGQLSPEIAKVPAALDSMGRTVMTTSKLMGGDQLAATEVLTTAMNQYGISLEDPIEASRIMASMMNVMSAASKEGSAELPQLKQALEQAGMAAKASGVSFEETNAAIEVLDAAGKRGSEGGIGLRNVLATLSQGRFLPKKVTAEFERMGININRLNDPTLSLAERLDMLKPLLNDSALLSATFGKENANAALALISQTDELNRLTEAITGTNSANEQAAIVMESQAEKNARLKARVDDFKISLFNATNGWIGYASVLGDTSRDLANLAPMFMGVGKAVAFLTNMQKMQAVWTGIVTGAQWALNIAMTANPIGLIVVGIGALIAAVVVCWNKFEGFRKVIFKGWEALKLFGNTIKTYVIERFKSMLSGIKGIGQALMHFFKGDWKKAWEAGGKAASDLMGVDATRNAINNVKTGWKGAMEAGQKASDEYTKRRKTQDALNVGISTPTAIPGAGGIGGSGTGGGTSEAGNEAAKTNESIATGGTKHNYITINLKDLIGVLNIEGKSFRETTAQMEQQVLDALLRVTASATTAAG